MKVVSLDERFEQAFLDHVDKDPLDYYFFILDLKNQPDQTNILLALEEERVEGLMLVYAGRIAQLRGNRKAVQMLLDILQLEEVELQAPPDCEDIVLKKYKPRVMHELILMGLRKGEETLQIKPKPTRPKTRDAARIAQLMREADPEWWGETTVDEQKESLEKSYWLGIKHERKLVSVGCTRFADLASNIGVIATDNHYRNLGFATSIVSALVQQIFKRSPIALIHVLKTNDPAVHVYSKVGFKPAKRYILMRASRIK